MQDFITNALLDLAVACDTPSVLEGWQPQNIQKKRCRPEYQFFQFAKNGCLPCVRRELEMKMRVSPDVASDSHGYVLHDFTEETLSKCVAGVAAVKSYLLI